MNKFKRTVMWIALMLIILLIFLSIYGAFVGLERAKNFFNSLPLAVYWSVFGLLLIVALAVFRLLVRVPDLLLMHAGCILIISGSMWGSQAGHKLQKKLFGVNKTQTSQMTIYEGYPENRLILENRDQMFLFSVVLGPQRDLDNSTVSKELRQEFKDNERPLSEDVTVSVELPGRAWMIGDNLKAYFVRKEDDRLNIYDPIKELPFFVRLKDFRLEYYKPEYLQIQNRQGKSWRMPIEIGEEFPLGDDFGTIKILRVFENFKIRIEGGKNVPFDDPEPGYNPALEVQIKSPDGDVATKYVFERFPGHVHPEDRFLLSYHRVISDYVSELQIIKNNKVVAEKNIEVNHPLHFGGYHFYQADYDREAGQYTVLMVVSDTGLVFVYAGYAMLCLGVFWHFWLKHIYARIIIKSK